MAKIRAVRPEFFTDEDLVMCDPLARLLFQGLWCHACDNGHLEDKPRQIKLRILPADECDVDALLNQLADAGCIIREAGWIVIPNLSRHQKIDKRYFVTCPKEGCKDGKPALTTRREAPPEHDEFPPDDHEPTVGPRRDHTVNTWGPHCDHGEATSSPSTDGDGDGDGDTSLSELRPDVATLLDHLDERIKANGAKVPGRTKRNADAARLLIDRDNRPVAEIIQVIDWAAADAFWKPNILSMSKLREKYDQLRMKALPQRNRGTKPPWEGAW